MKQPRLKNITPQVLKRQVVKLKIQAGLMQGLPNIAKAERVIALCKAIDAILDE